MAGRGRRGSDGRRASDTGKVLSFLTSGAAHAAEETGSRPGSTSPPNLEPHHGTGPTAAGPPAVGSHFDSKHHQHSYNHNYHHHTRHHSASPLMYPSIDSGATSPQPMPSDTAPDAPPRRRLKFLSGLAGRRRSRDQAAMNLLDPPVPAMLNADGEPGPPTPTDAQSFMEPFSARRLPEFAISEPTPHTELMDVTCGVASNPCVRYGDHIRLWTAMGGAGGFVGYAARDERRIKGTLPGTRFNFGLNDTFFVLPPFRHNRGWYFKETYFRVRDPTGVYKDGSPVLYGREVCLVDEEDQVMCHYRGRKYIRRKPLGTTGEMTVAFVSGSGEGGIGPEVTYGDTDIRLRLLSRKGLNTQSAYLSILKRDGIDAVGGFLNCQQLGTPLSFDIEHAPPRITEISISSRLLVGDRQFAHKASHHSTHWGEEIAFLTPSCRTHSADDHAGCVIRVSLSTGARLKMVQEHLDKRDDKGRWREVWVPTKGTAEPGLFLLMRLVHADTITTDPRRHFIGSASGESDLPSVRGPFSWLLWRPRAIQIPLGLAVTFVALALAHPPTDPLPVRAARLAETVVIFIVALVAYLVLETLVSYLGQEPGVLPSSMEFDEWRLAVVDWRLGGAAVVGGAVPEVVPDTFVLAENGDVVKARARYERTMQWRKDLEVDDILRKPHPKFRIIKRYYPVVFHFRDKLGHVCFYQILGKLNVPALLRNNVDSAELVRHTILLQEYLWTVLCPSQHDRVTLIMDLKGVTFADVTGEVISFVKQTVSLTSTHYPARSYRMLLLNVPGWFNLIFKLIKPMLNDTMRQKIVFLDEASVKDGLLEVIEEAYIPKEYGGKCDVPLGEAPEERQLRGMVETVLDDHDMGWDD